MSFKLGQLVKVVMNDIKFSQYHNCNGHIIKIDSDSTNNKIIYYLNNAPTMYFYENELKSNRKLKVKLP